MLLAKLEKLHVESMLQCNVTTSRLNRFRVVYVYV